MGYRIVMFKKKETEDKKIISFWIPKELHMKFKLRCVEQRKTMTEKFIELIRKEVEK